MFSKSIALSSEGLPLKLPIDQWKQAGGITEGVLFRSTNRAGRVLGAVGMTPNVVWEIVQEATPRTGTEKLAPHDLRRHAEFRNMPSLLVGACSRAHLRFIDSE